MEVADPQEGVSTPTEMRAPPSFARLTDLTDGSALTSGPAKEPAAESGEQKGDKAGSKASDTPRSRNRYASQEPEFNPWDA